MMARGDRSFPVGLRVLLVDHDAASLCSLEWKLTKLKYEVTARTQAHDALSIIDRGKAKLDLVITETMVPDMDGFNFVQQVVRLKPDLPVILMSGEEDDNVVRRGVEAGACHICFKPIREKELRIIWQHVLRNGNNLSTVVRPIVVFNKRKHNEFEDSATVKKPRIVWTKELHQKFLDVVNQIGMSSPKKILEVMNVEGLTREHVASHMQKYREKMNKLQDNGGGMNRSDSPIMHGEGNVCGIPSQGQEEERVEFGHSTMMSFNNHQESGLNHPDENPWNGGAAAGPSQFNPPLFHNNYSNFNAVPPNLEPLEQNLQSLIDSMNLDIEQDAHAMGLTLRRHQGLSISFDDDCTCKYVQK